MTMATIIETRNTVETDNLLGRAKVFILESTIDLKNVCTEMRLEKTVLVAVAAWQF